jgi:hypothetical protein
MLVHGSEISTVWDIVRLHAQMLVIACGDTRFMESGPSLSNAAHQENDDPCDQVVQPCKQTQSQKKENSIHVRRHRSKQTRSGRSNQLDCGMQYAGQPQQSGLKAAHTSDLDQGSKGSKQGCTQEHGQHGHGLVRPRAMYACAMAQPHVQCTLLRAMPTFSTKS